MQDKPLVSIVTPVFNGEDYLEELIVSIKRQDYPNIEHIVINDGSTDGTEEILRRHPQVTWWTHPNCGQYKSLNEGFLKAKGEWVTTISHDDRYVDSHAISAIVEIAQEHPEADVIHGVTRYIDAAGNPLPNFYQMRQMYPYWVLQYHLFITHCSMYVKTKRLVDEDMLFDEGLRYTGDADWIIRLYLGGFRFQYVDRFIADYRMHPQQTSTIANADNNQYAARTAERDRLDKLYYLNKTLLFIATRWAKLERRKRGWFGNRTYERLWQQQQAKTS